MLLVACLTNVVLCVYFIYFISCIFLDNHVDREFDEKALKRCSRIIAGYVATHSVSGQDNPYKVNMETVKGLRGTSTDSDGIKITVYTSMFDEEKIIFHGVLCGIEAAELQVHFMKKKFLMTTIVLLF